MKFRIWLESQERIEINDFKYRRDLKAAGEKLMDYVHDSHARASNFNVQQFFHNIQTQYVNYPQLKNLLNALNSKNYHYIFDQLKRLREWLEQQPYSSQLRNLSRQIYTYLDTLQPSEPEKSEQELQQTIQRAILQTSQNMLHLKELIEQAIQRIPTWNNSQIVIEPASSTSYDNTTNIEATNSAVISLGQESFSPQFMIFQDENKLEIDDVLDGGDEDFFRTPQIQADYFNLINELRKPGSTNKGKVLSLYTARPTKDRQRFIDTKTLPVNIFLSNDYDHVEGLSRDLGSNEVRDIWKVRIDSRYLTQTLDGKVKYYQITTDNAPVISIELINQGTTN